MGSKAKNGGRPPNMLLRLASAAIGIPLLVAMLWIGFWGVASAAIVVAALAAIELANIGRYGEKYKPKKLLMATYFLSLPFLAATFAVLNREDEALASGEYVILHVAIAFVGGLAVIALLFFGVLNRRSVGHTVFAFGTFSAAALASLPLTALQPDGFKWISIALFTVFAADTGAFFVGRTLGSRKLAPRISPGKTWEGLAGGIVSAALVAWLAVTVIGFDVSAAWSLGFGISVGLLAAAGDLMESSVKRLGGVKDSGKSIPGHGGMLDRTDSLIPNFLFVYFVSLWAA